MTSEIKRVVVLTALELETRAVLRHLTELRERTVRGTVFHVGQFEDREVAVAEIGSGNARAAALLERAASEFSPEIALFVGVAGGVKDVGIGDVVVATKVYGYESGKENEDGLRPRPDIFVSAHSIEQRARAVRLQDHWRTRLHSNSIQSCRIFVGPIAAGEKVVASSRHATGQFLRAQYGDALAVEMEGKGFLEGVYVNSPIQGGVVRGISDLLDNKSAADDSGSQERAAAAAAAVAFEMLFSDSKSTSGPKRQSKSLSLFEDALREFKVMQKTMEDISSLHQKQTDEYFRRSGVLACFEEEFVEVDTSQLSFKVPMGRFSKPFEGGVGSPRPLGPYYSYFVSMDFGETIDVFKIDIATLKGVLTYFRSKNPGIKSIKNVYVAPYNDSKEYKARKNEDFYHVPENGLIKLYLEVDEGTPRPLDQKEQFRIPYIGVERLVPTKAIQISRERGLIITTEDGEVDALPCLRKIWDLVEKMDRRLIEGFLERQIEQLSR